jgi:acyl-CoA thioesterase
MTDRMQTLDEATRWEPLGDGQFEQTIEESWANGPGAYGGVTAAALIGQMRRVLANADQTIRTLGMHLCAPLRPEPSVMEVRLDRRGRSISHLSARIVQEEECCATATATFAADRPDSPEIRELEMPSIEPPEDYEAITDNPMLPTFARNYFVYRYGLGHFPMEGADRAESGGWLNFAEPVEEGALAAACLLDAWPPSVFSTFETFRRTVTVDLRYQFFETDRCEGMTEEPYLFHARTDTATDGYAQEDADLWSPDGELVARAQQLYAVLD